MYDIISFEDVVPDFSGTFLVYNLLGTGDFSVIAGSANVGKSFFALDLALTISRGLPWCGLKTDPGATIYVACEGSKKFPYRIEAYKKHFNISPEEAKTIPFGLINRPIDMLKDKESFEQFIYSLHKYEEIKQQKIKAVFIDTLNRAMGGGDENSPVDMGLFIINVDKLRSQLDTHVCIVHHLGKDSERGSRGHSSLFGAVDTEMRITLNRRNNSCFLRVSKQKDYAFITPLPFKLNPVEIGTDMYGLSVQSCVVSFDSDAVIQTTDKGETADESGDEETPKTKQEVWEERKLMFADFIEKYQTMHGNFPSRPILRDNLMESLSPTAQFQAQKTQFDRVFNKLLKEGYLSAIESYNNVYYKINNKPNIKVTEVINN